ncbi:MAG: hypothetical protein ACRBF0_17730 [Calditrichia bacterium]
MRHILCAFICLTVLSLSSIAQNLTAFPVGENWQFTDARTLGMAGSGSVSNSGAGALLMNPAALGRGSGRMELSVSTTLRNMEERRSFPVFNRIDDVTTKGIYAINDNWYVQPQGGARYNLNLSAVPFLKAFAFGTYNEVDQDYKYLEEVRSRDFNGERSPLAYNQIQFEGDLTRYSFGTALGLGSKLDFGFQLGFLNGDLESSSSVDFQAEENQANSFRIQNFRSLDNTPLVVSAGAIVDVSPQLTLGSHVRLPYKVEYAVSVEGTDGSTPESYEYPMAINVGMEYRGRQELQSSLNVDFSYELWSETESTKDGVVLPNLLDDVVTLKGGIEHIFYNQIPLQFGLQYRTALQDRRSSRTLFSIGSGYVTKQWQVDGALGFSKLSYTAEDLFDDALFGGDRSGSPIDDVEERYVYGIITLKINFE